MSELFLTIVVLTLLYIAIMVIIIRWVFRINRIVKLLENIERNQSRRPPYQGDSTEKKKEDQNG